MRICFGRWLCTHPSPSPLCVFPGVELLLPTQDHLRTITTPTAAAAIAITTVASTSITTDVCIIKTVLFLFVFHCRLTFSTPLLYPLPISLHRDFLFLPRLQLLVLAWQRWLC